MTARTNNSFSSGPPRKLPNDLENDALACGSIEPRNYEFQYLINQSYPNYVFMVYQTDRLLSSNELDAYLAVCRYLYAFLRKNDEQTHTGHLLHLFCVVVNREINSILRRNYRFDCFHASDREGTDLMSHQIKPMVLDTLQLQEPYYLYRYEQILDLKLGINIPSVTVTAIDPSGPSDPSDPSEP